MFNKTLTDDSSSKNVAAILASANLTFLLSLTLALAVVSISTWFRLLDLNWLFVLGDQYLAVQILLIGGLGILLYCKTEPRNILIRAFLLNLLLAFGNSSIMFLFFQQ